MLNYSKKQEQHDYIRKRLTIAPKDKNLPIKEVTHFFEGRITPNRVIKNNKVYEITKIRSLWRMYGFSITTENNIIKRVSIFGFHPNRDPDTGLFCLPNKKFNIQYNHKYISMLLGNIKTFYLDDCFIIPPKGHVICKEIKSSHINF